MMFRKFQLRKFQLGESIKGKHAVAGSVTQYGQKYDENISRYKQVLLNRT